MAIVFSSSPVETYEQVVFYRKWYQFWKPKKFLAWKKVVYEVVYDDGRDEYDKKQYEAEWNRVYSVF